MSSTMLWNFTVISIHFFFKVRIVANEKVWDAADKADKRLAKLQIQTPAISYSAAGTSYSSKYLAGLYKGGSDLVPIIRNEE